MWASSHHFVYVELGSNSFQNKPIELYLVTYSLWKLDTVCSKIVVPSFPFHSMKWDDDYLWPSKLPVTKWPQNETAGARDFRICDQICEKGQYPSFRNAHTSKKCVSTTLCNLNQTCYGGVNAAAMTWKGSLRTAPSGSYMTKLTAFTITVSSSNNGTTMKVHISGMEGALDF